MPYQIKGKRSADEADIGGGVKSIKNEDKEVLFKDGKPTIQVKTIVKDKKTGVFSVVVSCCYCFKEHWHGVGVAGLDMASLGDLPDWLGHRVAHCNSPRLMAESIHGYNISSLAWKLSGRPIKHR